MKNIDDIKNELGQFDPKGITETLTKAGNALRIAERESKKQYAIAFLKSKESGEKISDKVAEMQAMINPDFDKAEADRIKAKGDYESALLTREDVYEANNNNKKLAGLEEIVRNEIGG